MKKTFSILLCLLFCEMYSQSIKEKLIQVNSIADAEKLAQENENLEIQLVYSIPEIEKDEFAAKFSNVKTGAIFSDIDFTYKVLFVEKKEVFRVSYVYLDGSKLSVTEIEKLRAKILDEYKNGSTFTVLVNKYTMDSSKDGDLGWFSEGTMVPGFELAIKNHKINDIFKIDLSNEKWYYVVLKTFNDKVVEELSILKVKNGI